MLIRALAGTSLKRSSTFPDLPTIAESGLPGFDAVLTYGLVAPAGTPAPDHRPLNKELREALATDEVQAAAGAGRRRADADHAGGARGRHRPEETKWSTIDQVGRAEAGVRTIGCRNSQ